MIILYLFIIYGYGNCVSIPSNGYRNNLGLTLRSAVGNRVS